MTEPTDLELMMYADGELDEARAAEVARFLGDSPNDRAHDKLFGLSVLSLHVSREADRVATAHRADDIASRVMRAIENADESSAVEGSPASRARVKRIADGTVTEKVAAKSNVVALKAAPAAQLSKPANDNSRFIYALTALAAAAAVALGIWGRGASVQPLGREQTAGAATVAAASVANADETAPPHVADGDPKSAVAPIESNRPSPVQESAPTVAVAAVNFGKKTGAVYYVPPDSPGSTTTTVVWVADE